MIGTVDIKLNAAKPNFPLATFYAFINSPSQVRVVNVPRSIGDWEITKVYVTANYPDNTSRSVECSLDGGCWHGTIAGSSATGTSANGFTISADGVKEDGETAVTGYVLGKGDVQILDTDGTITPGETTYYIHVLDSQPTTAKKGDAYVDAGSWKVYNGSSWVTLGGAFGSAQYVQYPSAEGGDGKWHRVIISDGAIAYDETGVDEPPTCATQTWVNSQIAAEVTARNAAITSAVAAEATARAAAVSAEETARQSADESLANDIEAEETARAAAVSAEAAARASADEAEITARNSAISSAIATEVTNRNSAISSAIATEVSNRNAAIAIEKTRAEGAESELNDAIVNEAARAAGVEATKVSLSGDQNVGGVKTFVSSPIVPTPTANMQAATKKYTDDAVAAEATVRAAADVTEVTNRNAAISTAIDVSTSGNNLVHKSGTETISGVKTFGANVAVNGAINARGGITVPTGQSITTPAPEDGAHGWTVPNITWVGTKLSAHTSLADNPHSVTKSQIGLGNCDNTSDADKPVSNATAAAIAAESAACVHVTGDETMAGTKTIAGTLVCTGTASGTALALASMPKSVSYALTLTEGEAFTATVSGYACLARRPGAVGEQIVLTNGTAGIQVKSICVTQTDGLLFAVVPVARGQQVTVATNTCSGSTTGTYYRFIPLTAE